MAPMITAEAVQRARAFVAQNGRPLDRAYLDHRLAATADSAARVVAELTKFQTVEGGFGRALEPDVRTPAPSAIATSIAFQYLRGIEPWVPADMAGPAISYLVRTVDRQAWVWPAVDERVGEGPHAPWWTPNLDRFRGYALNPTAELLGYLYAYRAGVPENVLDRVTQTVLAAVAAAGVIESPYELMCCMHLAQTEAAPAEVRHALHRLLMPSLEAADAEDTHLDLLRLTPTPRSFGYEVVRGGLERQAERLIASQAEDGGWRPTWGAWNAEAHAEWRGVITSQAVISLLAHGLVAT